jgi:F420-dependent oxidoreductase-like protein
MKLGLSLGYAPPGTNPADLFPLVQEAERLGFDSVWVAEAWGTDAASVLGWLAARTETIELGSAIMQIPGRTPANAAMTAATLDLLSGGRFLLGLGTSGPQVVEGWHGQPWGKPLGKTREYVEIVRAALRRERLEHEGEHYRIPWDGPGATGLGKPLKLMLRPLRSDIPIYLAALGPKNVALAAEIADGWLPIFVDPDHFDDVFGPSLEAAPDDFEIAATVSVAVGDDVDALRDVLRPHVALYVGGMGAKGRNFYNSLVRRYGWEAEAERIQELYLTGNQREAIAAVPDELVDAVSLVGPKERIAERLEAWRETPVTTLVAGTLQPEALRTLAELVL